MIYIIKLNKSDNSRMVIYKPYTNQAQEGHITSWNDKYIFVCFDTTGRGQACNPQDLKFQYDYKRNCL